MASLQTVTLLLAGFSLQLSRGDVKARENASFGALGYFVGPAFSSIRLAQLPSRSSFPGFVIKSYMLQHPRPAPSHPRSFSPPPSDIAIVSLRKNVSYSAKFQGVSNSIRPVSRKQ